jgi:hypothetical protein
MDLVDRADVATNTDMSRFKELKVTDHTVTLMTHTKFPKDQSFPTEFVDVPALIEAFKEAHGDTIKRNKSIKVAP